MAAFLDVCRFVPTAGGTTDWTFSAAVTGYQSPTAAGAVNGRLYKYRAESADLSQWEIGEGAYNSGTGVFARTTVLFNSAGSTAKINFTLTPQVAIVALKEDLISVEEANSFTAAQRTHGRANLGAAINELQNVSFAISAASGALTIALKDANGNDPTSSTPIALSFRNASLTASPNTPTVLEVTAASSVVVPSTSTLGFTSAQAGRLWITGWNDGGTFRLGVFNASDSNHIYPLAEDGVASSLQVVAAGNSAGQHYTAGAAVTSKSFRILGFVDWNASGVATAGTWTTTNLNSIVTFGPGIKKPGDLVQSAKTTTGVQATGTTTVPINNSTPTNTEGTQFLSQAITPQNAANILQITCNAMYAVSVSTGITQLLFQDSNSNALASSSFFMDQAGGYGDQTIRYDMVAQTTISTTFKIRAGMNTAGTTSLNGTQAAVFNGTLTSYLEIKEVMG
jgi:hypothetical protein